MRKTFGLLLLISTVALLFSATVSCAQGFPPFSRERHYGNDQLYETSEKTIQLGPDLFVHGGTSRDLIKATNNPVFLFTNKNLDSLYSIVVPDINFVRIRDMAANPDGSFVAVGTCSDSTGRSTTLAHFMVKISPTGQVQWRRYYNTGPNVAVYEKVKVEVMPDGYLLFTTRHHPTRLYRGYIIKTDLNGYSTWQESLEPGTTVRDVVRHPDGSYVLLCNTNRRGQSYVPLTHRSDLLFMKFRPTGDTVFTKSWGSIILEEAAQNFIYTSDNKYFIAGHDYNYRDQLLRSYYLKMDSAFNEIWTYIDYRKFDNKDVVESAGNEYWICGMIVNYTTQDYGFIDTYNATTGAPTFGGVYIGPDRSITSICAMDDTTVMIAGNEMHRRNQRAPMSQQFYMQKFWPMPDPIYKRNYCITPPTARFSYRFDGDTLVLTDSSKANLRYDVISKRSWDFGDGQTFTSFDSTRKEVRHFYGKPHNQLGGTAVRLVVYNNFYCTDTLTVYPWGRTPWSPSGLAAAAPEAKLSLYPNPVHKQARLHVTGLRHPANITVAAVDLYGRQHAIRAELLTGSSEEQLLLLQAHHLAAGVYLLRVMQNGNNVGTVRMLVQH